MAKRRNKHKTERRLAAIAKSKDMAVLAAEKAAEQDTENEENFESCDKKENSFEVSDSTNSVTEKDIPFGEVTENSENICTVKPKPRDRNTNDGTKMDEGEAVVADDASNEADETLIFPREIAGETCLDIECGTNEAILYLSKLCLGSKGSCILLGDDWLTPNEFQSVSGRETAKDWKRSIRHKGKSLKLLITKGLIEMHAAMSPKKPCRKHDPVVPESTLPVMAAYDEPMEEGGSSDRQRVSPGRLVKTKANQRLFKKNKGKKGRKAKKVKVKAKQNVALVRPLQKMVQEEPVDVTPEDVTEDIKLDVNEPEKTPEVALVNNEVIDEPPVEIGAEEVKLETALPPEPKTEQEPVKEEPAPTESEEKPVETPTVKEVKEEDADARTDEERRLDEFVKSLRLTKTSNVTPVKAAPQLIPIVEKKAEVLPEDPEDSEMPVLQKEPCIDPLLAKVARVTPEVDPLQAAVTPPPTPPSENPLIKKVVEEDQDVLFKVRLSSPSNGLKLTINREKVKLGPESEEAPSTTEAAPTPTAPVAKEQNIQAMLLQDALQSAKKYKEQLQQNKQQSFTAPSTHARKPTASVNSIAATPLPPPSPISHVTATSAKSTQEFVKPSYMNGTQKPLPYSHALSSHTTTSSHVPINHVSPSHVVPKTHAHGQGRSRVPTEDRSSKARYTASHSQPKTQSHSSSKAHETPTSSEVMAMMPHLYGTLPFQGKSRESTLAALQAFHLKDKMASPFGAHHAAAAQAQANLLHPVITQQLLMAMTQQLYSMYNIPQHQQQQHHQQQQQQRPKSVASVTEHRASQNSKSSTEIRHRHSDNNKQDSSSRHVEKTVTSDTANRKRKHSTVPEGGASEHVLDLSVKKQKTNANTDSKCNNTPSLNSVDSPLDFSVKRKAEANEAKHHKYAVHASKPTSTPTSVRHSFHNDYKYSDRGGSGHAQSAMAKPEEKQFPVGCTCKNRGAIEDISAWSVDMVCSFLSCLDGCGIYAKTFREQGITGRLLPYLTTQHLTRTLGMKVGPALTLMHAVERKFREQMTKQTCAFCSRNRLARPIQV